jgi:hypothetical protein
MEKGDAHFPDPGVALLMIGGRVHVVERRGGVVGRRVLGEGCEGAGRRVEVVVAEVNLFEGLSGRLHRDGPVGLVTLFCLIRRVTM